MLRSIFTEFDINGNRNASGISDGAASLIVASEDAVKKHNMKPLARVVNWFYTGVDPSIMGIGPVPAIRGVLKRTGLSLKDMSRIELNEAFAVQYLACEKELGLDRSITNINGGAISLGKITIESILKANST